MLALIKRRTLALLRKGVEPVEQVAYARFLAEWQGIGSGARGTDAVLATLEQLAGYPMPASARGVGRSCRPGSPTTPRPCWTN